ncbi:hypothetical protein V1477_003666, partial [Vespula maculifrons]
KYAAIRSVVLALIYHEYYLPRSHHVEVAASGDPRANGDSTLKFANQTKSITVGLLIAPENITSMSADTSASVLSILPNVATLDQNQSTKIELVFSILKEGNPHRSPHPRAPLMGPTRKNN